MARYYVQVQPEMVQGELTIDHAASSCGNPVLVIDGVAYGPADREWPPYVQNATPPEDVGKGAEQVLAGQFDEGAIARRRQGQALADQWNTSVQAEHPRASALSFRDGQVAPTVDD